MDENIVNYRVVTRSKKWWRGVFAFCMNASVHNDWQFYGQGKERNLRQLVIAYSQKYGKSICGGQSEFLKTLSSRISQFLSF